MHFLPRFTTNSPCESAGPMILVCDPSPYQINGYAPSSPCLGPWHNTCLFVRPFTEFASPRWGCALLPRAIGGYHLETTPYSFPSSLFVFMRSLASLGVRSL